MPATQVFERGTRRVQSEWANYETRIAKLEVSLEHMTSQFSRVDSDIREVRSDIKSLLHKALLGFGFIIIMLAGANVYIYQKTDKIQSFTQGVANQILEKIGTLELRVIKK